jgi:site-specific DNA-methyltransferase (adenine-specific)
VEGFDVGEWGLDLDVADPTADIEVEEDDFDPDAEPVPTTCKAGDVWQLGNHRLMCGDSTKAEDVAKLMQGEQADLWLTDPPYNVSYEGGSGLTIQNDKQSDADFSKFLHDAFKSAYDVMKEGCPFYVWTAQGHIQMQFATELDNVGLPFRQQLIWNKSSLVLGHMDYHWKHEPCFYGWKEGAHYFIKERNHTTVWSDSEEIDIDKMKKAEMQKLLHEILDQKEHTTVINCEKPPKSADHPTMKPVRLFGYLMKNSSRQHDIILDTFGGSGTTIVAAEQLDRKARLMELDPHYCDVIIARWEKLTGKKAIKLNE